MPKEPITCPHCGSSDCVEYSRDSFVCKHCDTAFKWVDPTHFTVTREAATCSCGKNATAKCRSCGRPLCEAHQEEWSSFVKPHEIGVYRFSDAKGGFEVNPDSWFAEFAKSYDRWRYPVSLVCPALWAESVLERLRLPEDDDILCRECHEEFLERLKDASEEIADAAKHAISAGRICGGCLSVARTRCAVCGAGVCDVVGLES